MPSRGKLGMKDGKPLALFRFLSLIYECIIYYSRPALKTLCSQGRLLASAPLASISQVLGV